MISVQALMGDPDEVDQNSEHPPEEPSAVPEYELPPVPTPRLHPIEGLSVQTDTHGRKYCPTRSARCPRREYAPDAQDDRKDQEAEYLAEGLSRARLVFRESR